jgi:[acyl-carrier-protein] S-malonyltransferase
MEQACQKNEGTMAALMGWTSDRVERFVEELRMPHDVWIANYNCFGQIVLSGTKRGMEAALQKAKEQGIKRALLLNVQGAFHSGLMRSAEEAFAPVIEEMPLLMQKVPIVMNVSAKAASSEAEVRKNLISQVMGSVRWEQSLKTMQGFDPDCFIEVGPGKTLTGFAKRTLEQVTLFSIEKLEDFDTLSQSL